MGQLRKTARTELTSQWSGERSVCKKASPRRVSRLPHREENCASWGSENTFHTSQHFYVMSRFWLKTWTRWCWITTPSCKTEEWSNSLQYYYLLNRHQIWGLITEIKFVKVSYSRVLQIPNQQGKSDRCGKGKMLKGGENSMKTSKSKQWTLLVPTPLKGTKAF